MRHVFSFAIFIRHQAEKTVKNKWHKTNNGSTLSGQNHIPRCILTPHNKYRKNATVPVPKHCLKVILTTRVSFRWLLEAVCLVICGVGEVKMDWGGRVNPPPQKKIKAFIRVSSRLYSAVSNGKIDTANKRADNLDVMSPFISKMTALVLRSCRKLPNWNEENLKITEARTSRLQR